MSNIFSLVSYACGGKTSLLPVIKWNLELKYPDKHVIVLNESVSYGFVANNIIQSLSESINVLELDFDNDYTNLIENVKQKLNDESIDLNTPEAKIRRQISFLSSSLAQIDLLSNFINNDDFIIVMDRSFIDVLIFTYMNINDFANEYKGDENKITLSIIGLEKIFKKYAELIKSKYNIDIMKDINYILLKPPTKEDIVKKCMERIERKVTISKEDFYEKCKEFEMIFRALLKGANYKKFTHPADNTYVAYQILDFIVDTLSCKTK